METIQHQNMNVTNKSISSSTSLSSHGEMIVHSTSLMTIDLSSDERVNMIEADDCSETCTTNDAAMELTPYPYSPTSEELADYYQLEQSLGEDWTLRLACELSYSAVSIDESDNDDFECVNDDSVTFFDDQHHHDTEHLTGTLPEDIEVRAYTRKEAFIDRTFTPIESFDKLESF
jgi:hypothetical protein